MSDRHRALMREFLAFKIIADISSGSRSWGRGLKKQISLSGQSEGVVSPSIATPTEPPEKKQKQAADDDDEESDGDSDSSATED